MLVRTTVRISSEAGSPAPTQEKTPAFARDNTLVGDWIDEYDRQHDAGLNSG